MCRALGDRGVDCDLVCTNDNGQEDLRVSTGHWTEHEGVRTWFFQKAHWPIRALEEFQVGRGFSKWLEKHGEDYDLFHVHALFSHLPTRAIQFARQKGIPYVMRPLGILENYSLQRSAFKKKLYLDLVDGPNLRSASAVHLTSEREQMVSELPTGVPQWVVPLGVTVPASIPTDKVPGQILFLSRWHPKKRIPLLLEALSLLKDLSWHLVLGGDGDHVMRTEIHAAIQRLGLSGRVEMPGFLTGDQKWKTLGASEVFILPSASENFGIAVAEAMAAGVPVVITKQVALASDVQLSGGGWVFEDSAEAIAEGLKSILKDRNEIFRRGKLAAEYAGKHWSWTVCARALSENYQSLLKERSKR
jgi:glycosyltransferase involved in cell wall biosynthesis